MRGLPNLLVIELGYKTAWEYINLDFDRENYVKIYLSQNSQLLCDFNFFKSFINLNRSLTLQKRVNLFNQFRRSKYSRGKSCFFLWWTIIFEILTPYTIIFWVSWLNFNRTGLSPGFSSNMWENYGAFMTFLISLHTIF